MPKIDRVRKGDCPKCGGNFKPPAEHPNGLPGILYHECYNCGYAQAITKRPRRERLDEK
jgi:ribosomal protein S27AE